jgi:hypothetical protein
MITLLELAKKERARLDQVIRLLEGSTSTTTTTPPTKNKPKLHGKVWTDAERKAMSVKMKAIAAKRKKG